MPELGFEFAAMASPCELRLLGPDEELLRDAARQAVAEVQRIERKYSRYDDTSIVSRLNALAGSGKALTVDDETAGLLDFAGRLHALSGGLFDITSGVLRRAWDFRRAELPSQAAIDALLPLIGWGQVMWNRPQLQLLLPLAGMEIDFGGFGKEYAADRAAALLQSAGITQGFVTLGGDIRVLGPSADSSPWTMGIRHPRRLDRVLATLPVEDGAMATSGDYERFIEVDGRRYCHVLDPRSGWPVQHWQSITVLGPTCAAAGSACTVAMLLQQDALDFLEAQNMSFVAVDAEGAMRHRLARLG